MTRARAGQRRGSLLVRTQAVQMNGQVPGDDVAMRLDQLQNKVSDLRFAVQTMPARQRNTLIAACVLSPIALGILIWGLAKAIGPVSFSQSTAAEIRAQAAADMQSPEAQADIAKLTTLSDDQLRAEWEKRFAAMEKHKADWDDSALIKSLYGEFKRVEKVWSERTKSAPGSRPEPAPQSKAETKPQSKAGG